MDGQRAWTDNIFIEGFWRSLKYEEVTLRAYDTGADAKGSIRRYVNNVNTIRPHASLGGRTQDRIQQADQLLMAS